MKSKIIALMSVVVAALAFFSCGSPAESEAELEQLCVRYIFQQKPDSLRMTVDRYRHIADEGTPAAAKVQLYAVLEQFVAKDYDATLAALKAHRQEARQWPDVDLQYAYYEARCHQRMMHTDEAIAGYKAIVAFCSHDDAVNQRAAVVVWDALTQLMNTYQSAGCPVDCSRFYEQLVANPTSLIKKYAWRDLLSVEAYAFTRTERTEEACSIVDQMLKLPMYKPNSMRLFRDYSYAAAAFYADPKRQNDVIRYCVKAIDEAWKVGGIPGMQWMQTMLASIYQNTGHISDAISLYEASIEKSRSFNDLLGEVNAYNLMTDLYLYWGLTDFAERSAANALKADRESGGQLPMVSSTCYRNYGVVKSRQAQPDSAEIYFRKAEGLCRSLPYNSGMSDLNAAWGTMLVEQYPADSLPVAVEMLSDVMQKGLRSSRTRASLGLAKAYFKMQRNADGERMLDSLYTLLTASESPYFMSRAYTYALRHYLDTDNEAKMKRLSDLCLREINSYYGDTQMKAVANLYSHYENEKTMLQLQLAQSEASSRRNAVLFWIAFSVALFLALAFGVVRYVRNQRFYQLSARLAEQKIMSITNVLEQVSTQREEAESKLEQLLRDSDSREQLSSQLPADLLSDGEAKFRTRFQMLYPMFLSRLRAAAPEISKREELLCMLVALRLSNDQIADILCIERKSVNMARHRLRKKFGMDKDTSLDDVVVGFAQR